jgi:flagellar basal-body rod protein FlgC
MAQYLHKRFKYWSENGLFWKILNKLTGRIKKEVQSVCIAFVRLLCLEIIENWGRLVGVFIYNPVLFGNSPLSKALYTASSGMLSQNTRLEVVAQNLANAHTTATNPNENPYSRKTISFRNQLDRRSGIHRVIVNKVGRDETPFSEEYDPSHPAADENGMVKMPNVNRHIELRDMHEAMRAHHVNLNMVKVIRDMIEKTIAIMARA